MSWFVDFLSSPLSKNISVFPKSKSSYMIRRPASLEGRFAIVTDARRDAVDADAPETNGTEADGEVVWSRNPHPGVKLAEIFSLTTVAKKPRHPVEPQTTLNNIAP